MQIIWEVFSGLGAVVGLVTGGFVVWDRFFRFSPTAILFVRPLIPGGVHMGWILRVSNRAERPILLSWQTGNRTGEFLLAADDSMDAIVASMAEGRRTIAVDPGEVRELVVTLPTDFADIDPENYVECRLFWRYAQPMIWKRERYIDVRVPKRSLLDLDPDASEAG